MDKYRIFTKFDTISILLKKQTSYILFIYTWSLQKLLRNREIVSGYYMSSLVIDLTY